MRWSDAFQIREQYIDLHALRESGDQHAPVHRGKLVIATAPVQAIFLD
jgi:hypothetical protein